MLPMEDVYISCVIFILLVLLPNQKVSSSVHKIEFQENFKTDNFDIPETIDNESNSDSNTFREHLPRNSDFHSKQIPMSKQGGIFHKRIHTIIHETSLQKMSVNCDTNIDVCGECGGVSRVDHCNVCGGDNRCVSCNSTPGTKRDACGSCSVPEGSSWNVDCRAIVSVYPLVLDKAAGTEVELAVELTSAAAGYQDIMCTISQETPSLVLVSSVVPFFKFFYE
ncbi:hypothetical protein J6590_056643 [Homalodisca vitripennis]|nr:hypothetical protein J6590_056643 [Homalodisca vitripennis]